MHLRMILLSLTLPGSNKRMVNWSNMICLEIEKKSGSEKSESYAQGRYLVQILKVKNTCTSVKEYSIYLFLKIWM